MEALFDWGTESEGLRPEEIFKFSVSEMPFPELWERFDKIPMVRKQHFSMSKFTISNSPPPPGCHGPGVKYNHCLSHASVRCKKLNSAPINAIFHII